MKLVTYSNSDTPAIGALLEDSICPFTNDSSLPNEMKAFLEGGEVNMNKATDLLEKAENFIPVDSVTLLSPILNPQKILAIGLNYADHVKESGMETPKIPMVFNKQSSCVGKSKAIVAFEKQAVGKFVNCKKQMMATMLNIIHLADYLPPL